MRRAKSQRTEADGDLPRQLAALKRDIAGLPDASAISSAVDATPDVGSNLQNLVAGLSQGILVVGLPDWRPVFANEAVARIYGFGSAQEMMHLETLQSIVHPEDFNNIVAGRGAPGAWRCSRAEPIWREFGAFGAGFGLGAAPLTPQGG